MKLQTEVLIVGAGPAGSVAALTAKRLNLSYVLIERETMPRDKVCGDGILLKDVTTILNKLNIDIFDFINQQNLHQPSYFLLTNAADNIKVPINTVIVKRKDFDNYLWNLVDDQKEGALKFDKVQIKDIIKSGDRYEVFCVIDEKECIINTTYIIGADGYSSYVRRNLFNNVKFNRRVASRFYMKANFGEEFQTAMYFDKEVSPGYFWCFKINENTYNTGVYLSEGTDFNPYDLHNYYLKKYLNKELPKDDFKTWPIPYNIRFDNLVNDNVLLVGDAAGLCDKMFGHGIDNAIISGYLSVLSIKDNKREDLNYLLQEIYPYNLNNYMGDTLRKSVAVYDIIDKQPHEFLNVIKQYV